MRLVLRGDNFIYYRNDKIAKVQNIRARPMLYQATVLVGIHAGKQTPRCETRFEVLQCVWAHHYLDQLF